MGAHTAQTSAQRTNQSAIGCSRLIAGTPPALLVAAVGILVWLLIDPRTPDLAAQVYRVSLYRHQGFAVWDEHWYAGHHLPGYSLLFPPLAALLGMRTVGALAVLASATLFERLARGPFGEAARWGAVWFALAALADVWIGRLTFALGVALALACLHELLRGRTMAAVAAAVLCALASPVAGVLLGLAVLTRSLFLRSPRATFTVAVPVLAVVLALALLFPEGGWEPFPTTSLLATGAVGLSFLWALPAAWRWLRPGAYVYLAACLLAVALHTPVGANLERYGVLSAGPVLLCALLYTPPSGAPAPGRLAPTALLVLCGIALWTIWGPVRETIAVAGDPSTGAAYYTPLERFLATHGGSRARVEVPFTRGHWEAAWLAPSVSLARGWEKQLDTRYDDVLLAPGLTASSYLEWLRQQGVTYVALPDAPLDPSSAQEGVLIRRGLPYLRVIFTSAHWRVYRVLHSTPLLQGPGRLSALGHDAFALQASASGSFEVRVRYTRYWTLTRGSGCVAAAPAGWTSVTALRPGTIEVAARFSLGRALGLDASSCRSASTEQTAPAQGQTVTAAVKRAGRIARVPGTPPTDSGRARRGRCSRSGRCSFHR